MRSRTCALALVGAAAAASTPAGWSPSSNNTLGESFEGIVVTPGITLSADSKDLLVQIMSSFMQYVYEGRTLT